MYFGIKFFRKIIGLFFNYDFLTLIFMYRYNINLHIDRFSVDVTRTKNINVFNYSSFYGLIELGRPIVSQR